MNQGLYDFISLDLPAMLAGTLAVVVCGLLGNFLLLRRMSLMGDAISHSVLPGLVAGFLIAGTRDSVPMFLGAAAAGLATVLLVETLRKLAKLESGAAMGVVFSILFAAGIVLIEQAAAGGVDLDPECVLNGQLESVLWFPPREWPEWSLSTFDELPRELGRLAGITALAGVLIAVFFKELRLAAFDPALAQAIGLRPRLVNGAFMLLVAAAVVASFEAVGSILVVAMLVCPAAIARMLTDRLAPQIWVSLIASVTIGIGGYIAAVYLPGAVGLVKLNSGRGGAIPMTLSAAGMMTVVGGGLLTLTVLWAPRHGVISRRLAQRRLRHDMAREDLLAGLYRIEEGFGTARRPTAAEPAIARAVTRGEVIRTPRGPELTAAGREEARELVRRHRLWEHFLVEKAALRPDHVHPVAERLEHIPDPQMAAKLRVEGASPRDPHGRPIP